MIFNDVKFYVLDLVSCSQLSLHSVAFFVFAFLLRMSLHFVSVFFALYCFASVSTNYHSMLLKDSNTLLVLLLTYCWCSYIDIVYLTRLRKSYKACHTAWNFVLYASVLHVMCKFLACHLARHVPVSSTESPQILQITFRALDCAHIALYTLQDPCAQILQVLLFTSARLLAKSCNFFLHG